MTTTIEQCSLCGKPTGKCGEDSIYIEASDGISVGPLCVECLNGIVHWVASDACISPNRQALYEKDRQIQCGVTALLECSEKMEEQAKRIAELEKALPDASKLRVLADWFDKEQRTVRSDWTGFEVQEDLRSWAEAVGQVKRLETTMSETLPTVKELLNNEQLRRMTVAKVLNPGPWRHNWTTLCASPICAKCTRLRDSEYGDLACPIPDPCIEPEEVVAERLLRLTGLQGVLRGMLAMKGIANINLDATMIGMIYESFIMAQPAERIVCGLMALGESKK